LRVRFLADANLDQDIVAGVLRREPEVDFTANACPGLILVPSSMLIKTAIEEILLIWHVTEAEEWTNLFRRMPLRAVLLFYGSANTFSVIPETIATYCLPSWPS
jgi:hypothetical protein